MLFKWEFFLCLLLTCAVIEICTQVPSKGRCPYHPVVQDFNVRKFSGKWYEIERFFAVFEIGKKCVTTQFDQLPTGDIRIVNRGINKWTKKQSVEVGRGRVPYADEPAKFDVIFPSFFLAKMSPYWVLDTDYKDYAVIWSCKPFLWFFNRQYAWILSRQRTLSEEARIKIYHSLDELGVKRHKFYLTDQINCPEGH